MTMLLSTFHQSGKARQENFGHVIQPNLSQSNNMTATLLLSSFLLFSFFSPFHKLSYDTFSSSTGFILHSPQIVIFTVFQWSKPQAICSCVYYDNCYFRFRRWHLQLHLQNRLKWLCAQTFRALLTSAVHFSLFWDHMQGNISFALCKPFHSQVQPRSTLSCRQVMRLKTNID